MTDITLLLVDDQDLLRAGMAMVLGTAPGLRVVGEATNGQDAVERAAELRPDVVLMDVRMPGLDGIEATRRIVADGEHLRFGPVGPRLRRAILHVRDGGR